MFDKLDAYYKEITGNCLTEEQQSQFETYYTMLVEKNKVMNLTAITERDEVELKHFIDSIALANYYDLNQKIKVIDVGTGAGFPGIPLKIAFPEIDLTLFDSLNKRILFLEEVVSALKLKNVKCIHGRAEEGGRNKDMREKYDLVVSRAVANMAILSEYCMPFVSVGGNFIPYKSGDIDEEVSQGKKAVSVLGGKILITKKLTLPDSDIDRSFVIIKKIKATPGTYPRKAGTASKKPIA